MKSLRQGTLNLSPYFGRSGIAKPPSGSHRFLSQRLFNLSGLLFGSHPRATSCDSDDSDKPRKGME
jgi:hypothetical protein